jgi:N-methylhydantoinase B
MSVNNGADPITREVVQNRLISIVREMSTTLQRAAYSPIIFEVKDFSSVLLRPNAELVAQAEGIPGFLGCMHQTLGPVIDRYPLGEMRDGDVFVSNDPYSANGSHKNDVNILKPVFWGEQLVLFAVTKAHWTDIGGKDPGSWSPDAANTYQEGVSIPPLRLYRDHEVNGELLEIILANTRLRENNYGDLMAQVSACNTAEHRVHELLNRYGLEELDRCIDSMFDYVEAKVRAEIEKIPDGTYTGVDWVDSDGVSDEPIRFVVETTVEGGDILFDLTGCEAQRPGANGNSSLSFTTAVCRVALTCLFGPHEVKNEGFYRPMRIKTTPGTVVHPVDPAPCTTVDNVLRSIMEAIFFSLAEVAPHKVAAGIFGGVQAMAIAGDDPRSTEPYIHFMPYAGGWGARSTKDGINALCPAINGDNYNIPCEVIETKFPLAVERYELIQDSGGAGEFRGGLGVRIDYRILSSDATVSAALGRYRFSPPGLFGGKDGMKSSLILNVGTPDEANRPLVGGARVQKERLVSHRCGGGGGVGDPGKRDRHRVIADLENEYISAEAAERDYGIVRTAHGAD